MRAWREGWQEESARSLIKGRRRSCEEAACLISGAIITAGPVCASPCPPFTSAARGWAARRRGGVSVQRTRVRVGCPSLLQPRPHTASCHSCAAGALQQPEEQSEAARRVPARPSVARVVAAAAGRQGREMRQAWVVVVVVAAMSGGAAVLANHDLPQQEADQPRAARILPTPDDQEGAMNARTAGWVAAAYDVLQALNCATQRWTTEAECRAAQRVPRRKMQVWATPTGQGRFVARLPDGSLARRGGHDGVVLLDPFPAASWGHPLVLLLVANNTSQTHCTRTAGHWLGEFHFFPLTGTEWETGTWVGNG